ncbi:MAG: F0F1 ATP synthase subunit B' [Sedimentitalea sp.]|nr:F0F1 ATP synthase subunit B' [Sedimentitalea sp.]
MATETTGHVEPVDLEAAGSCVDAHGGAIGMPQLCFDWFPNQMFWLVVTLVVIFLILSRVALPRIAAILSERQGTISNDIAAAEDLKARAVEAEKAYEKALADARAEAQRIIGEARAEIQADLNDAIAQADAEIAARSAESEKAISEIRAGALEAVREVAAETAAALVAALGNTPDSAAIAAAVDSRLKG